MDRANSARGVGNSELQFEMYFLWASNTAAIVWSSAGSDRNAANITEVSFALYQCPCKPGPFLINIEYACYLGHLSCSKIIYSKMFCSPKYRFWIIILVVSMVYYSSLHLLSNLDISPRRLEIIGDQDSWSTWSKLTVWDFFSIVRGKWFSFLPFGWEAFPMYYAFNFFFGHQWNHHIMPRVNTSPVRAHWNVTKKGAALHPKKKAPQG